MVGEEREGRIKDTHESYDNVILLTILKFKIKHSKKPIESPFFINNKSIITTITTVTMKKLKCKLYHMPGIILIPYIYKFI